MQADKEQNESQLDMQPRRMHVVRSVRRDQAQAGENRKKRAGICESAQVDALKARQRLLRIRGCLLRMTRERHGRYEQSAYPKHQTKDVPN